MKALYQKIRSLNGKNYGLYKSLAEKIWNFGDFSLEFLHVQGDPFAPASRVLVKASLQALGFASEWSSSFERRLALADFLLRRLSKNVLEKYPDKNATVAFEVPGPEMLVRNALWIDNGDLRACLQVRLPADGRKIQSEEAAEIINSSFIFILQYSDFLLTCFEYRFFDYASSAIIHIESGYDFRFGGSLPSCF